MGNGSWVMGDCRVTVVEGQGGEVGVIKLRETLVEGLEGVVDHETLMTDIQRGQAQDGVN